MMILSLNDVFDEVTELVTGKTLTDLVRATGSLDVSE